jgi:hypothetical protein
MDVLANFLEFLVYSMIESFAIVAVMLAIFRFKVTDYIWPTILLILTMSLQSYVLREELSLSTFVPIINLVLLTFFTMQFVKVPLIWSVLISSFGSVVTILLQVLIVALSGKPVEWFQTELIRGHFLQSMTGIVSCIIAYLLFKFGIGLSFSFEKLRFKWENFMIYTLIGVIVLGFGVLASQRTVFVDILFLLFALLFFVYYTIRKETRDD